MSVIAGMVVLLLSCIGNAELWVILMNRRHSLRYRHHVLRRVRHFHDAGLTLFPLFLFAYAGFAENGLLRGGTFSQQPRLLQAIIAITCCGLIPFTASVVRWQMGRSPKRFTGSTSETFDTLALQNSEEDRNAVIGDTSGLLWKFPWNQIYQLEVNRKQLDVFGNVQPESNSKPPLKLAHFSDVHIIGCPGRAFHDFVADKLCELQPDAFVFTGDLLDRQELLPWAVDAFERMAKVAPAYFILGNHDWHLDVDPLREALVGAGWTDVAESVLTVELGGRQVLLAGTEAPWMGQNPQAPPRSDESLRILLSHTPDQRDFAFDSDFDLMLSGHNHGGQVRLPVIGPVYSPSKYGVRYSGGVYEYDRLLIHVSRGVSSMDALRWNCRPEITLLELNSP